MFETRQKQERLILLGVELQESENFSLSMQELARLAQTAGADIVHSYTQKKIDMTAKPLLVLES